MTILVIEDEKKLALILEKALKSEKFAVDLAFDGEEGLEKAKKGNYTLIVLDLMLPKKEGMEVCRELRENNIHTPIIILTAKGNVEDRVKGLDCGADDYVMKPFGIEELFARIRAVLRRRKTADQPLLKVADLVIDPKKHEVTRAGKIIKLTPKEYRLLDTLVRHLGQALTRRQLIDDIWGPEFNESNNELNVHMRYLRRKIDEGRPSPLIETIRGVGYTIRGY